MAQTLLRRTFLATFVLVLGVLAGLAAVAIGAPFVGYEAVIVRGASMEPALPIGSLILVSNAGTEVPPGAVVTVRRDNGALVTHRVVRVIDGDPRHLELKGDHNEDPDARPVPITALVGTVTHHVPVAGFLAFLLRQPSGLLAIVSLLGSLLLAAKLLEPEVDQDSADAEGPAPLSPAARQAGAGVLIVCLLSGGLGSPPAAYAAFGDGSAAASTFSTAPSW